jgi:hypothetical protein
MLKFLYGMQKYETTTVYIGKKQLTAILADSFIKKMIGLMFRSGLDPDTVMLFDFGYSNRHGIWMRNMRFPIDILWVSESLKVIDFAEGVTPSSGSKVNRPSAEARYVIEAESGFTSRNNIEKGEVVKIKK